MTDPEKEPTEEVCDKCGEDPCVCEDETCPDCGKNPCECDTPNQDFTPLQPGEQKEKLAEVGQKLMDKMPASDFNDLKPLVEGFSNAYLTDVYNWDALSEWFDNAIDTAYKEEEKSTLTEGCYTTEWTTDMIILLSNHKGRFTLGNNAVTVSDYDGLQMVFSVNGKDYVAEITSHGKVTEALYVLDHSWTEFGSSGYWDYETDTWISTDDYIDLVHSNTINFKVGVPEKVVIRLTENGASKAEITAEFESQFTQSGVDLTTDSFATTITARSYGYEIVVGNTSYNGATGKAEYRHQIKKDGVSLVKTSVTGNVKLEVRKDVWEDSNYRDEYTYVEVRKADGIKMNLDILGEIQAKGSCANALDANESIQYMWEALYDNETANETEAKRHLDNFNAKIDINVYYDGTDTKQAAVEFDLQHVIFDGEDFNGDGMINDLDYFESWDLIPIITFNDGSKYKIEEFFTENAFGELVDSFYEFCESFAEVFAFDFNNKTESTH